MNAVVQCRKFFINWDALARTMLKNDFHVQITKNLKSIKESKETKRYLFAYLFLLKPSYFSLTTITVILRSRNSFSDELELCLKHQTAYLL